MKTKLCVSFLMCAAFCAAQTGFSTYLVPGPFALCQIYNSPILCGVWTAEGKPVQYELMLISSDSVTVAYSYTVTGTLAETGEIVTRSGFIPRANGSATAVMLSFGGRIQNPVVVANELEVVPH